jgi:hypothetical protein
MSVKARLRDIGEGQKIVCKICRFGKICTSSHERIESCCLAAIVS